MQLQHAIDVGKRKQNMLALLFLDLDRFKDINDTAGHHIGDRVLQLSAETIRACLRREDLLARLGGDEFVILIDNVTNTFDVHLVAEKIIKSFEQPVSIEGKQYHLSTSVGISIFPDDGEDVHTLQKNADIAMYEAKAQGRGRFIYYQGDPNPSRQRATPHVGRLANGAGA